MGSTPCKKVLVLSEVRAVTSGSCAAVNQATAALVSLVPEHSPAISAPRTASCRLTWDVHRQPPPSDLVVTFQRFLI